VMAMQHCLNCDKDDFCDKHDDFNCRTRKYKQEI
jgi:hypothetical protein